MSNKGGAFMAHVRKCTLAESGHLCTHYARGATVYSNSEVDAERTSSNYNLGPERDMRDIDYIRSKLDAIKHSSRKDLVVMADWIITAPQELGSNELEGFFKATYDFMVDRYGSISGLGEDVCISSYVHMDETTPHMHFAMIPVVEKHSEKRFCAKEVICRADLKSFHGDLQKHLDERGISVVIQNGNTTFDANGKALSVKALKRSTATTRAHKSTSRWSNSKRNIERGRW